MTKTRLQRYEKYKHISYEYIHELFDYHEDGQLLWKVSNGNRSKIGGVAGGLHKGCDYHRIRIGHSTLQTHCLIWIYHYGHLPENFIDHIDQNKLNNRIENLREVTRQCNARNCRVLSSNTSGVVGVYFSKNRDKWISRIIVDGKTVQLGAFSSFNKAVRARWEFEMYIGWNGCNSTSSAYLYMKKNNLFKKPNRPIYRGKLLAEQV